MRVKGKRILKNGTIAGYVYNSKTKKWNWRFIGRQTGGDRTDERRQARQARQMERQMKKSAREMERQIKEQAKKNEKNKKSREASIKSQLLSNETSRKTKSSRNTKFNSRSPYQKERNVLLNYLNDKVRRTAFFRPKRKKKFRNISNRIRNSLENNNINVLKKAYHNIGLIINNGTRNDPKRFKNLTNKVVDYRTQREKNKIEVKKQGNEITKRVVNGKNF